MRDCEKGGCIISNKQQQSDTQLAKQELVKQELVKQEGQAASTQQKLQEEQNSKQKIDPKVARLGTAPLGKLLFEFGVPAVAAVVLNALYNVIDSVFLGQAMGKIGLAATTVATPLMTILLAICMLAGAGGNALCAILLGEGKHRQAEKALGNTFLIIIAEAIIIAIFAAFCLDPILRLAGASDETLPYARLFMQIIAFGCLFNNISFGINNFIRTAGAPYVALGTATLGTVACVFFNYLFVMVFGWGVAGSASATILGQAISSVWVMWFFTLNKKAPFHLRLSCMHFDSKLCLRILALGLAPFALQCAAAINQMVGNFQLAVLGAADPIGTDGALASIGVVMKIVMFSIFPAIGISISAQPILGFNVGARKYERVKKTLYLVFAVSAAVLVALFAVVHIWPEQLMGMFGVDESLMRFSVETLKVCTILIPFIWVQINGSNYFQATGQPLKSSIMSVARQIVFQLPLYFILPAVIPAIFSGVSPLFSFCLAFPVTDALSIILCSCFVICEIRRLNGLIAQQKAGLVV